METPHEVGIAWLLRLRWGAVVGQLLALAVAIFLLHSDLPYPMLLGLTAVTAITNLILGLSKARLQKLAWIAPTILFFDGATLTVLLSASGGPSNPFTVFYLVHVALAAVLLEPLWNWLFAIFTMAAFGALFRMPYTHNHHDASLSHLTGMWIAYALAAAFVAYFVGRVSHGIRERDRRLIAVSKAAQHNERLASLSAFSANAAHELGSPLGTIALAAKELHRGLQHQKSFDALKSDADLVYKEAMRCRQILSDLSLRAGELMGEMSNTVSIEHLIKMLTEQMSPKTASKIKIEMESVKHVRIITMPRTLTQILHSLIQNALEAQARPPVDAPIELFVKHAPTKSFVSSPMVSEYIHFVVRDHGPGFNSEVLSKLGEPFVTTKSSYGGLGLGLYLAHTYAARTGGTVRVRNMADSGAEVILATPINAIQG